MHPAVKEMYDNIRAEAERQGFVKVVCAVRECGKPFVLHSRALAGAARLAEVRGVPVDEAQGRVDDGKRSEAGHRLQPPW